MTTTDDRMTPHTHGHAVALSMGASQLGQVNRGARIVASVKGINGATSLIRNEIFRHVLFQSRSFRESGRLFLPESD
jgi:hypothetical protein